MFVISLLPPAELSHTVLFTPGVRGKQEGGVRCLWEEPKGAATKRAGPSMQLWPATVGRAANGFNLSTVNRNGEIGVPLSEGNGAGSETIDDQGGIGAMAWQA